MIDPQQHADNLFQVARRVGALVSTAPSAQALRRSSHSSLVISTSRAFDP